MAHEDLRALRKPREGRADLAGQPGVELVGHNAPDVVSLEDVVE
jgi:hypothetical protein